MFTTNVADAERVVGQFFLGQWGEHVVTGDEGGHDHEAGRREQPPCPPSPEVPQPHGARALQLTNEQRSDEEAGDHVEDVDAYVPAAEGTELGVVEEHEDHGDGTQPLDVRPKAAFVSARRHARRAGSRREHARRRGLVRARREPRNP